MDVNAGKCYSLLIENDESGDDTYGKIITIGREFGSGGREVGKRLSDELGIAYYDNEIITEIAKRTELAEGYVQHVMENGPTALMPITIGRTFIWARIL